MDIHRHKEELRKKLLNQREAITESEFYGASADIIEKLKEQSEYNRAKVTHCYVSMNKRREVETRELIREMLSKGREVAVPVTHFEQGALIHVQLTSYDQLQANQWGVLEPDGGKEISLPDIDLVIVPMVGGDEHCNRIGYGEGFYDRFLKEVSCPKIGLLFEQNIIPEIPVEEFDIPLDKIITERRVIHRE